MCEFLHVSYSLLRETDVNQMVTHKIEPWQILQRKIMFDEAYNEEIDLFKMPRARKTSLFLKDMMTKGQSEIKR